MECYVDLYEICGHIYRIYIYIRIYRWIYTCITSGPLPFTNAIVMHQCHQGRDRKSVLWRWHRSSDMTRRTWTWWCGRWTWWCGQSCRVVTGCPSWWKFPTLNTFFLTTASSNQLTKVRNKVELAYLFLHKAAAIVHYVLVGAKVCQHSFPKLC